MRQAGRFAGPGGQTSALWRACLCANLILLCACQSAQSKLDTLARDYGYQSAILSGSSGFKHQVYFGKKQTPSLQRLHVYLAGDGLPWLRENIISVDPTGYQPMALKLMARDTQASVYLGRPCYHGFYQQGDCNPLLWTHARYSETVVESMSQVLRQITAERGVSELVLVGYSGGGVLAMLLAERLPQTIGVLTVAANLDIDAWADYHHYSRLSRSLNPMTRTAHYQSLRQYHLAGERDRYVPADITRAFVKRLAGQNAQYKIYAEFDHTCCWLEEWPNILGMLDKRVLTR